MSEKVLEKFMMAAATFSRIPEIPRCGLWTVGLLWVVSCLCL